MGMSEMPLSSEGRLRYDIFKVLPFNTKTFCVTGSFDLGQISPTFEYEGAAYITIYDIN